MFYGFINPCLSSKVPASIVALIVLPLRRLRHVCLVPHFHVYFMLTSRNVILFTPLLMRFHPLQIEVPFSIYCISSGAARSYLVKIHQYMWASSFQNVKEGIAIGSTVCFCWARFIQNRRDTISIFVRRAPQPPKGIRTIALRPPKPLQRGPPLCSQKDASELPGGFLGDARIEYTIQV